MNRAFVSKAEFARMRGITPQAVGKMAKDGRIVLEGTKVNVQASMSLLNAEVRRKVGVQDWKEQKTRLEVQKLTLEVGREARELIQRDDVERVFAEAATTVKDRLLALPSKLAPVVASMTDATEIRDLLSNEFRLCLTAVSQEVIANATRKPS